MSLSNVYGTRVQKRRTTVTELRACFCCQTVLSPPLLRLRDGALIIAPCVRRWIHRDLVREWIPLRSKNHSHRWDRMWSRRGYGFPKDISRSARDLQSSSVRTCVFACTYWLPVRPPSWGRTELPKWLWWTDYSNLEIRSRLTVFPREDVCCCLIVLTGRTSESRDLLEIHSPPSWARSCLYRLDELTGDRAKSSLVKTWEVSLS